MFLWLHERKDQGSTTYSTTMDKSEQTFNIDVYSLLLKVWRDELRNFDFSFETRLFVFVA